MTKKDYELIAENMQRSKPLATASEAVHMQWGACITVLATALQKENPKFDRFKFLRACGMNI
jgi:hypothetical protein